METRFSEAQLRDPATQASEQELRRCVHCGFCTATCPTYVLLGDELDSPRGRIYLIKEMLETGAAPSPTVVKHVDRCLSCLSCVSTCPSGVNYMHLVDHARAHIEQNYRRPWPQRAVRMLLAQVLPYRRRMRLLLGLATRLRPLLLPLTGWLRLRTLQRMLALAPPRLPASQKPVAAPATPARGRVVLLQGCAEPVLRPQTQVAAARLLGRMGFELAPVPGEVCCGALVHHLGQEEAALEQARRNVGLWQQQMEMGGLAAILVTASGCGTALKNYAHMLRNDPVWAEKAAQVSALVRDISEFVAEQGLPEAGHAPPLRVAYHAACSLQHGQGVREQPKELLTQAGFTVLEPADAHLCCGSAGTYNLLQPEIADQLRERKLKSIAALDAEVLVSGNIGCQTQLSEDGGLPVLHTVELLDWATGGPDPL